MSSSHVFFLKILDEIIKRLSKLKFEDPDDRLVAGLRQKLILDKDNAWKYLSWDRQIKCLRPTKKESLILIKVKDLMIQFSQLAARTELIQRFSALKPMNRDQIPDDTQSIIPWRLDISIRSEA